MPEETATASDTVSDTATVDSAGVVLRPLRPGDLGWVVQRHGVLYAEEYGWNNRFEAMVARIAADYVDRHQPHRENAWIAEVDGRPAGSVFCVGRDDTTAMLRLLLVEPAARGRGAATRLVAECVDFARSVGYRSIVLWTVDELVDARRIYERAGFELVREQPYPGYGYPLTSQDWELHL